MTPEQATKAERMHRVCARALQAWGKDVQWEMVIEECAELIAIINRSRRGRSSIEEVASEVADVMIVVMQARLILGPVVDAALARKIERLERRLDKAEGT